MPSAPTLPAPPASSPPSPPLPHSSLAGHAIAVTDTAANLTAIAAPALAYAATATLSADGTVAAAGFATLRSLPQFSLGNHTLTVANSAPNLLSLSGSLAMAGSTHLTADSQVSAAQLSTLAALPGFGLNGHTLAVSDQASALLALPAGTLALAASIGLGADATLSASQAAELTSQPGFALAGHHLTVADTAAALLSLPATARPYVTAETMTAPATLSAADATTLATTPGFSPSPAATLTVADHLTALLNLPSQVTASAAALVVTSDATISTAQLTAFTTLPHTTLNGHAITIADTAPDLLAAQQAVAANAAASVLIADASVTASQLQALAALPNFATAGHALAVSDTAANILATSPAATHLATSVTLSADATLTAAQTAALMAEPGFAAGAYHVTVADTAANLLALPTSIQLSATTLALAGDQSVSAATLGQLAALGIKFTEAGHSVICTDTAANLAALQPATAALAAAELLAAPATVTAAVALALAALPHFGVAPSATLTVQDSVPNVLAMGAGAPAATACVQLSPGNVVVSAAQAHALSVIPHFTVGTATVEVSDSVAALTTTANTGWQTVANRTQVTDTAANLAANASAPLLQTADAVTLSGNAQITANAAAQIASIPHFTAAPSQLDVIDSAAAIAAHVDAILAVASNAVVTGSGPVSTAMADQLAIVSGAGLLSFQGGNQLLVQDSFAALTSQANASGVALAARLGVLDTASNLVTASTHDWGALNPSYALTQDGLVTATQAQALANLGTHFSPHGHILTAVDGAAAIVGAAPALASLAITADVIDTAANLGAQANNLANLGNAVATVQATDMGSLTAAAAAALAPLASKLTGPVLHVVDTAGNVVAALTNLAALGTHIDTSVIDSAAAIGAASSSLAGLSNLASVSLTDTAPVTAATAAALAPLSTHLVPGTTLAVTDTGAATIAHLPGLLALGQAIGALTLSDGTTQIAAVAAALAPLDQHLGAGIMLTATGDAASVAAHQAGLSNLQADHRLAAVIVADTTVQDATSNAAALNTLAATVSITDSAAAVDASLQNLAGITGLTSIALTDASTPVLALDIATLAASASVLAKIASPFSVAINDTAAQIKADLISGASVIAGHLSEVSQIVASDGAHLNLSQGQLLATGIDDGPASALAKFTGAVDVSGVDTAHVSQVMHLAHPPATIAVVDSAAAIAADLTSGNSALTDAGAALARIDVTGPATLRLTANEVLATGVDDGPTSVLAKMHGATLSVTDATVSQLASLAALQVPATTIMVSDTAASISADLASPNPALVSSLATLANVAVSDGGAITLTEAQALATNIDDGAGSMLARLTGGSLAVTGVAAGDLAAVFGLPVAPGSVTIADTAAHVVSNLSTIVADIGAISSIETSGAPLVLTAAEALSAHTDDGPASLIGRLVGHAFAVSGASISQLAALTALQVAPTTISIIDSSNNIAADLTSNTSALAVNLPSIGAITVTHGTLHLTEPQAEAVLNAASASAVMAALDPSTIVDVGGATVADIPGLLGAHWPNLHISVADSAGNIAADLASGSPQLAAAAAAVVSVTLTAGGTVDAATLTHMAALPSFSTGGAPLAVSDTASALAALPPAATALATLVHVGDTDSAVSTYLDALQAKYAGALSIELTNTSPSITVQAGQYAADAATLNAIINTGAVAVAGNATAVAPLASEIAASAAIGSVTVTDAASNVIANLASLQAAGSKLAVTLTDSTLAASAVIPLLTISNLSPSGIPVVDTGAQIAELAEANNPAATAYLNAHGAALSGDSIVVATEALALQGLTGFSKAGYQLNVWDTAAHLTTPAYQSALASSMIDAVHLKTFGGAVTVAAATAATLFTIRGFSTDNPDHSTNTLNVSDSAAHIEAQLASLTNNRAGIGAIAVNAPATITDQVLNDLQGLGAVAGSGAAITVRDTAAAIADNAAAQSGLHSIVASAWALSDNGVLNEAQAVTLGNLAHFSSNGYTISLNLTADTAISLADANALGNIAGALNLGGYHLVVDGNAAQLEGLTQAALGLVTPALIDSFANIAALPAGSPLLAGTVEVTGNAPLNAASVATFLGQVHASPGQGITEGNLTFDQVHTVSDTIANLRGLSTSAGWTGNTGTHQDFSLVARDSAANLADSANSTFLSGLAATGLASDATISAASATNLANVATTIHFQHDHLITVQDSPTDLLNPANAPGLGIANFVRLAMPVTVDAADAESLLSIAHFSLTVPLAISDSSANLLDGHLSGAINASGFGNQITIHLAGPETLDADTAESLVSLPGFADTTNLTIADGASYLINSANLTAEQIAASVTLSGDETVSANTVLRLAALPHFTPGTSHLVLAGNDFADAATLHAIAGDGSAFLANGHTVTLTQDVLNLSPTEYAALQTDHVVANGHMLGVAPALATVADHGALSISATGIAGGTVHIYGADGALLTSTTPANAGFTITIADPTAGQNYALTQTVGGVEGAPLIVLDDVALEHAASLANATFGSTGAIQVAPGLALNLYEAGSVPAHTQAALVYDPVAHTISLEGSAGAPVTLITLGGTAHPASLDAADIIIKHHS